MTFHFYFLICKLPIQIFIQCLLTFKVSIEKFAVRFVTKMACIFVLINLKKKSVLEIGLLCKIYVFQVSLSALCCTFIFFLSFGKGMILIL